MKFLLTLLAASSVVSGLHGTPVSGHEIHPSTCFRACRDLAHKFPGQMLTQNSTAYNESTATYWAQQQNLLEPACVFQPVDATQVAFMVTACRKRNCPFAVKSGGHGAFAGASNIQGGITLTLGNLNEISISDDNGSVTIGTGSTWGAVYEKLGQRNLAVAGGRYPSVGVGGLSLGGGQSFFASTQGWTCDNIYSHQVVLANGQVIEANGTLHPDLHWALRGGGNNFGIVTKITMEILPLRDGRMWGGLRIHQEDQFADVLKAANNLGHLESEDGVKGAQIINFMESQGQKLAVAILTHSDPKPNPPAMSEYLSIQALVDTTSTRSLTNMSKELASSEQQQQGGDAHYFKARGTATFLLNQDIMTFSKDVCFEMFGDLTGVEGVNPACVFQIITKAQMNATLARGGNALGLDPEGGPLFLLNVQVGWTDEADSQRVRQAVQEMIERTVNYGKEKGRDHHFRYMNYAGEFQDVIAGYQKENKGRLIAISERYDPTGVFELL